MNRSMQLFGMRLTAAHLKALSILSYGCSLARLLAATRWSVAAARSLWPRMKYLQQIAVPAIRATAPLLSHKALRFLTPEVRSGQPRLVSLPSQWGCSGAAGDDAGAVVPPHRQGPVRHAHRQQAAVGREAEGHDGRRVARRVRHTEAVQLNDLRSREKHRAGSEAPSGQGEADARQCACTLGVLQAELRQRVEAHCSPGLGLQLAPSRARPATPQAASGLPAAAGPCSGRAARTSPSSVISNDAQGAAY